MLKKKEVHKKKVFQRKSPSSENSSASKVEEDSKKYQFEVSAIRFPSALKLFGKEGVGITQSLLQNFLACERKGILSLNRWERKNEEVDKYGFGGTVHEVLDLVYSSGVKPDYEQLCESVDAIIDSNERTFTLAENKVQDYKAIIPVLLDEYFTFYASDFKEHKTLFNEKEFSVSFFGVRAIGKIDRGIILDGARTLMEHKTKGKIDDDGIRTRLPLDFQTLYYALAWKETFGAYPEQTLYNVIRKPYLKRKPTETMKDFGARLRKEIRADYDHFFKRWLVPFDSRLMMEFEFELKILFQRIIDLSEKQYQPLRNLSGCFDDWAFPCDFLEACASGCIKGNPSFFQRDKISPELVGGKQ